MRTRCLRPDGTNALATVRLQNLDRFNLTIAQLHNGPRVLGNITLVGHNEQGVPLVVQAIEKIQEVGPGDRVEVPGRLVREQNGWIIHQGTRDALPTARSDDV